jgi:hypothetical protein
MTPGDVERYANEPDPWPKVSEILRGASLRGAFSRGA